MRRLKRYLITGLIVVVPGFLTIYVIVFMFRFLDGILGKFLRIHSRNLLGFYIPGTGLLLFLLAIVLIGFLPLD